MFKIRDGRAWFYQWDSNQKLIVRCDAKEVHFCNGGESSLVVEVKDGMVDVPNILFQSSGWIRVYAYIMDADENYTLCENRFKIVARSKPDSYVYEETEVLCYESLDARITALEEGGGGGGGGDLRLGHALYYDEFNRLSVRVADEAEEDNTLPITSAAVQTTVGNIEVILRTI